MISEVYSIVLYRRFIYGEDMEFIFAYFSRSVVPKGLQRKCEGLLEDSGKKSEKSYTILYFYLSKIPLFFAFFTCEILDSFTSSGP